MGETAQTDRLEQCAEDPVWIDQERLWRPTDAESPSLGPLEDLHPLDPALRQLRG